MIFYLFYYFSLFSYLFLCFCFFYIAFIISYRSIYLNDLFRRVCGTFELQNLEMLAISGGTGLGRGAPYEMKYIIAVVAIAYGPQVSQVDEVIAPIAASTAGSLEVLILQHCLGSSRFGIGQEVLRKFKFTFL